MPKEQRDLMSMKQCAHAELSTAFDFVIHYMSTMQAQKFFSVSKTFLKVGKPDPVLTLGDQTPSLEQLVQFIKEQRPAAASSGGGGASAAETGS